MIAEQAELNLSQRPGRASWAGAVRELEQLLRGRGWQTRRDLQRLRPEWTERRIRLLASTSRLIISGPGTPGYILATEISDADLEQLEHAGNSLISQGRDMARRGIRFRRLAALRREQLRLTPPALS